MADMYYFKLASGNLDFATELNEGVRPLVQDENGQDQYYVVNFWNKPNEIISAADVVGMRNLVQRGTQIRFFEPA
jgi:hypothetical protein